MNGYEEARERYAAYGVDTEAALTALNRAPGLGRSFAAQKWPLLPPELWQEEILPPPEPPMPPRAQQRRRRAEATVRSKG